MTNGETRDRIFEHPSGPLRVTPRPGHSFDKDDVASIEREGGVVDRLVTRGSGLTAEVMQRLEGSDK